MRRTGPARLLTAVVSLLVGLALVPLSASVAGAATVPTAPGIGSVKRGDTQVQLTWTAPVSNGGSLLTEYVITPYVGVTALAPVTTVATSSITTIQTLTGLTNGTTYRFSVAARNAVGLGPASALSASVTPATTPTAPAIGAAVAGDGAVSLRWSAPTSNGGAPVTAYVVVPYVDTTALAPVTFTGTATTQLVTGLTNGTTYRFRVRARNAIGVSGMSAASVAVTPVASSGPTVELFNGGPLRFGSVGVSQPDVNVLGRVSPAGTVTSLTYQLNGGPQVTMGIGPDTRRLANPGDFNVAVPATSLQAGANTITLRAVDVYGRSSTQSVAVSWSPGNAWPLPYTVNWSTTGNLFDVVQPTDGRWQVNGATVRTVEMGYDRLLSVGDTSWTSYEATVPITIHAVDPNGYTATSGSPGVGFLVHWQGHSVVDALQPKWGFAGRYGAIAWYRYRNTGNRLELRDGANGLVARDLTGKTLALGTTYLFKVRAEAGGAGLGPRYQLKVWPAGAVEPATWDLTGRLPVGAAAGGSLQLVAHHVDASFGTLTVVRI